MEIKRLEKEDYEGIKFSVSYESDGYYDIKPSDNGFDIKLKKFDNPKEKTFNDIFFSEWLDNPIAYGIFIDDELIAYIEGFLEKWNNRFRLSNLVIFDKSYRNKGLGTILINKIEEEAKKLNARMIVLETQSCNVKAINFYKKMGFEMIGFDLYAYTNYDIDNNEIRVEMAKKLM